MIREAAMNDAARVAEIDAVSSRYAYGNLLPEDVLKDLSAENRIPVYRRWIGEKRFGIYVYEDEDSGIIRGMMGIGPCEDEDKAGAFELHFLYADPAYVRTGIGSELLRFFEQAGREKGCPEFVVWVLEGNGMGRSFYEKHHYRPDGKDKIFKRWNQREIRYVKPAGQNAAEMSGVSPDVVFESENILYVRPSLSLVPDYLEMVNDIEHVARFISERREPYTEEEERSYMEDKIGRNVPMFSMLEKKTGRFIGNLEFMNGKDGEAEWGIVMTYKMQGKGYGTEALKRSVEYGFAELGLRRIYLAVYTDNPRAIHVYEKCGFREYDRNDVDVFMDIRRAD